MMPLKQKERVTDPSFESFLFFCQVIDEQVYDFTDHSFKAPALNTFTRTLELQAIAESNHKAGLGKATLAPFIDELEWSVARDPSLSSRQRSLCQTHISAARSGLDEPDRIARSLAGLRITLRNYFEGVKNAIRDCIKVHPNRKEDISKLAAAFVVQAEAIGYPRRHTYHVVQLVFRHRMDEITADNYEASLNRFFDRFSGTAEYDCTFIASSKLGEYAELITRFQIENLGTQIDNAGLSARQLEFIEQREAGESYYCVRKIKSPSAVWAHEICTARFSACVSVIRFVKHRLEIKRSKLALVRREADGKTFVVRDSIDPMHSWAPNHGGGEEEMLAIQDATYGAHFVDESRSRFARAIKYHGAALHTESPENQLVDLWAGLEGLLSRPRKGSSRIEFFSESLLPSITLSYPEKLLRSLYAAAKKEGAIVEEYGKVTSAESDFAKFVHFMLCEEYNPLRLSAAESLKGLNPLLLNRCWDVSRRLATRSAVRNTLFQHRTKVKWHIERIYAMRNSIMHDASALPYLSTLVENLHLYVDLLVNSIARVAISASERISIESALQYLSNWEQYRLKSLADKSLDPKSPLKVGSVWDAVFGVDLAISPAFQADA